LKCDAPPDSLTLCAFFGAWMTRKRRRAISQMHVWKRALRLDTYLLCEQLPTGAHTMSTIHNEFLGRAVFVATILVHLVKHFDVVTQFHPLTNAGGVEPTTKGFWSETALVKRTYSSSRIIRLTLHNILLSANKIIPQLGKPAIAFARYHAARRIYLRGWQRKREIIMYPFVLTDTNFEIITYR